MDTEPMAVIGSNNPTGLVPGESEHKCFKCNRSVWISPRGTNLIRKGARPVCLACVPWEDVKEFRTPTAAQIAQDLTGGNDN